jgi:hypothetical protein
MVMEGPEAIQPSERKSDAIREWGEAEDGAKAHVVSRLAGKERLAGLVGLAVCVTRSEVASKPSCRTQHYATLLHLIFPYPSYLSSGVWCCGSACRGPAFSLSAHRYLHPD